MQRIVTVVMRLSMAAAALSALCLAALLWRPASVLSGPADTPTAEPSHFIYLPLLLKVAGPTATPTSTATATLSGAASCTPYPTS
ncbi:MAG: hypothetical protein H5T63_02315 [Chloroflexi bacterium]|nr:hypothetical protein [Chloroflexota bacterium]